MIYPNSYRYGSSHFWGLIFKWKFGRLIEWGYFLDADEVERFSRFAFHLMGLSKQVAK
jgi:hypothetical protein